MPAVVSAFGVRRLAAGSVAWDVCSVPWDVCSAARNLGSATGCRRRPRRVFFFCPLCAVCQPFAFHWKNILKKSAKKFGPYGEVVVPLHPISGKKSRGRERSLEALHGTTTEVQEERDRHWRPFSGRVVRKRLRLGPELCPEIRSERCPVRARHGPRVPGAVQAWQCRPFYFGAPRYFYNEEFDPGSG